MLNTFGVCCVLAAVVSIDFDLDYNDKIYICSFTTK